MRIVIGKKIRSAIVLLVGGVVSIYVDGSISSLLFFVAIKRSIRNVFLILSKSDLKDKEVLLSLVR